MSHKDARHRTRTAPTVKTSGRVAVINYGLGNLRSVCNALEFIGATPFLAESPDQLRDASHAILPGVGAFPDGMNNLVEQAWVAALVDFACQEKRPLLGICLGMQLLMESSTEHGYSQGLGLLPGKVQILEVPDTLRVPHIGWNSVTFAKDRATYAGLDSPQDYYFVHSYAVSTEHPDLVSASCEYGAHFVASVERENIWGVQFHPEKSHKAGLQILKNFVGLS